MILNYLFLGVMLYMSLFIIIFLFAAISADLLGTLICFIFFLLLLLPFYLILDQFKIWLFFNGIGTFSFFNSILSYAMVMLAFIGIFLFVQLMYLVISG